MENASPTTPVDPEIQLVKLLGERFIARKDVKARQFTDGSGWAPVRENGVDVPFKMQDFRDHLAGKASFGHYLTNPDGMCKLFAYDIDLRKVQPDDTKPDFWVPAMNSEGEYFDPRQLWAAGSTVGASPEAEDALRRYRGHMLILAVGLCYTVRRFTGGKIHLAIGYSGGKGLHVYGFTGLRPVADVHRLAVKILEATKAFEPVRGDVFWRHKSSFLDFDIEVFPKQKEMEGKEYGNLMALPLGVHQGTGQRKFFLDAPNEDDVYGPYRAHNPIDILTSRLPWGDEEASVVSSEMWRGMVGHTGEDL